MKRDPIKYVRDKAKANYRKGSECAICGSTEDLDFHHYNSLTALWEKWGKGIETREEFIAAHYSEVYEQCVTLCKTHHKLLHKIYGLKPGLHTAEKQKRWVEIQHDKRMVDRKAEPSTVSDSTV